MLLMSEVMIAAWYFKQVQEEKCVKAGFFLHVYMHSESKANLFLFMSENENLKYISKHFLMVVHFLRKKQRETLWEGFEKMS